jgi:hypothetical protein
MEEEKKSVDKEFQEFEATDEEFEHECVKDEDTSQWFVDWDSPPIYDEDVNEEVSIEQPLASVLEEEHEEDGFFLMIGGLYPSEDEQLGGEEPIYDIAEYEEVDEGLSGDVFNYNEKEVEYVDFIGVDAILSNSSNQVGDEIYMVEGNVLSKGDGVVASYLKIFMAYGKDKAREKHGKSTQQCEVQGLQHYHSLLMIKAVMFLMRCVLVMELRRGELNELTGHPKDRGKNRWNSRMNSLQPGENDADWHLTKGRPSER